MSYRDYEKSISTDQYKNQYLKPLSIPHLHYLGSRDQKCSTTLDCHQRLSCINGVCRHWIPTNLPDVKCENIQSPSTNVFSKEKFNTTQYDYSSFPVANEPQTPKHGKTLCYTRKYQANSGRNWY